MRLHLPNVLQLLSSLRKEGRPALLKFGELTNSSFLGISQKSINPIIRGSAYAGGQLAQKRAVVSHLSNRLNLLTLHRNTIRWLFDGKVIRGL